MVLFYSSVPLICIAVSFEARPVRLIQSVHFHDNGVKVSRLHEGLLYLIENQGGISDGNRSSLRQQLEPDLASPHTFGEATLRIVKIWQEQLKSRTDIPKGEQDNWQKKLVSPSNGDVDEFTAKALNWLLRKIGAFRKPK